MGSNSKPSLRAGRTLPGLIAACLTAFLSCLLCLPVAPAAFAAQQSSLPDYQYSVLSGLVNEPPAEPEAAMHPSAGIGGFLGQDGRLTVPEDFSGSLDPAGFEMVLGEDGAPRFLPQGGPADPDERWDDQFFLGSGCDGTVLAIAQGAGGELYLGGDFVSCGGVVANSVVRFEPATQTFSALGSGGGNGVNGTVNALAVSGSELYVGGSFLQANVGAPINANRIARWNGSEWSALGSGGGNGVNSTVNALAVSDSGLYAGGFFIEANFGAGIPANRIAHWNGSEWSALGSGGGNGVGNRVNALAVSGSDLYVGGDFTQANLGAPITANRIARWDGGEWSSLGGVGGNGVDNSVLALAVSGSDLYVGGGFTQANVGAPITANRIARWDGGSWSPLGSGDGNGVSDQVTALAMSGSEIYVGGIFISANVGAPITANRVARWNGSNWSVLGSGDGNGVSSTVRVLAVSGGELYVGGLFTQANVGAPITANRVARWSGSSWSALGSNGGNGVNIRVRALAVSGSELFVGGLFTVVGGVAANNIARWNGSNWSAVGSGGGNGVNGEVSALAVSDSELFVGGAFTQANLGAAISVRNIARWDGDEWSVVGSDNGNGVNSTVSALAVSGSELYVGGWFTEVNFFAGTGIPANRIARWNGSEWSALGSGDGNGVNATVSALAVSGSNLYVGGVFTQANIGAPISANHIARWNGSSWSALGSGSGNGVNSAVSALAVSGSELYVGGAFTQANVGAPITANRIARWDGSDWFPLGSGGGNGVSDQVNALAVSGSDLYVGGTFLQTNIGLPITANRIARWNGSNWSALGSGTSSSVFALALSGPDTLYVGGDFQLAGNKLSSRIGRYTTRGTLTVELTGTGTGSTSSDPTGLHCPSDCSAMFTWYQPITLSATADPGSVFVGWSGGGCSGTDSCVIDFDQDTSVTAEFDLITYSIGGTALGLATDNSVVLRNNDTDDLIVSANDIFTFPTALPDGSPYLVTVHTQPTDPNQTCVVANEAGDLAGADVDDVEVTCITDTYTVTTTAINGDITSTIDPVIEHGLTTAITGEAGDNHYFASVSGCSGTIQNNSDQSITDFTYETGPIAEHCIVEALFAIRTYTVTTSVINGIITSTENPVVDHGETTTVTANADENYYFASASGCGGTEQTNTDQSVTSFSYDTGPITEACTVEAVYAIRTYTMSVDEIQGEGTVDVLTLDVDHNDDAEFEVTPDAGWSLASFTGNTCTPVDNEDGTWTASNIMADCEVTVVFIEDTATGLDVSHNPAIINEAVTYTVTVTGTASAPLDGQVELVSDQEGTICSLDTPDSTSGNAATFTCQHAWTAAGSHQMTATFSASATHADSNGQLTQQIVTDEFIFQDRFESDQ
jgi:trimeric autotransporter adhesin